MRTLLMRSSLLIVGILLLSVTDLAAQSIPPPTGPVVFCGTQAQPDAVSYQLVFDGGAPEPLAMDAAKNAACAASDTHSFQVPAARFTVGNHTAVVRATNTFGTTVGPTYTITVGIAPGQFTITAVVPPSGGTQSRTTAPVKK